jgi:hypothetical protein
MVILKSLGAWSMNASLLMGTDKMILRYAYHKAFKVQLPNEHEWQNRFNLDNKGGLVWYTDGSKTNEYIGAGWYKWGMGHSFSLGLHTTVFRAEINAIKMCIIENTRRATSIFCLIVMWPLSGSIISR